MRWGPAPAQLDPKVRAALKAVRLVAFDFDGVMTDNRVYVNERGEESVACSRFDGLGIGRLRALGIASCIVSTEVNAVVGMRAKKLKMDVEQAVDDKIAAVERFAARHGVAMAETAFVGNDINDLAVLKVVGVPIVVADAHPAVRGSALHITERNGGEGAVREVCDLIADVQTEGCGMSLFELNDRVVVVTGCLGQLGRQFITALAEHGARVVGLDRFPDAEGAGKLDAHPALKATQANGRLLYLGADVTDKASLEAARARAEAHYGAPVYGLVNNAALDSPPDSDAREVGPFETYPVENWEKIFAVNAKGPFLCCQVFGASMAEAGRGSIVNVGSIYGVVSPDQNLYQYRRDRGEVFFKPVAYSASKSSLYNLTRYLAGYWGKAQVRVNIVTFAGVFNNQDPKFLERYLPKVPLGRMADQADYNGTIVYLMSDASTYMTGSNVVIDGGFSAL